MVFCWPIFQWYLGMRLLLPLHTVSAHKIWISLNTMNVNMTVLEMTKFGYIYKYILNSEWIKNWRVSPVGQYTSIYFGLTCKKDAERISNNLIPDHTVLGIHCLPRLFTFLGSFVIPFFFSTFFIFSGSLIQGDVIISNNGGDWPSPEHIFNRRSPS